MTGRGRQRELPDAGEGSDEIRILVAEDNPHHQILILRLISQLGLAADLVEDGVSALGAMKRKRYHLLLLDLTMPLMGGLEVARAVVKQYPRTQRPVMVAVTALSRPSAREECLEAGLDEYLPKPLTIEDLQSVLGGFGIVSRRVPVPSVQTGEAPGVPPEMRNRLATLVAETDREFVTELIDTYIDAGRPNVSEIERAFRAREWEAVKLAAHTLKGSSRNVGGEELAALLQEVEEMAESRRETPSFDPGTIRTLFEKTAAELRRYRGTL
jgi:CheY-like chemotaxis protein